MISIRWTVSPLVLVVLLAVTCSGATVPPTRTPPPTVTPTPGLAGGKGGD